MIVKKKVRVCLIGAGRIGFKLEFDHRRSKPASHFGMWLKNKDTKFVGIAEKTNLNKFIKNIPKSIKIYTNYIKMIKELKPQIVSIATWKDSHFSIAKQCIEMGVKNIVLEKPLANNIKQATKLHKIIKLKKVNIFINHRRRFDEEIIKLKKIIDRGIIGKILHVNSNYVFGILTTGTHLIDTLRMLLVQQCGEITHVSGFSNKMKNFCPKDDTNIDGKIFFRNGLCVNINSLNMKAYDNFDISIFGTKGKLTINGIGRDGFIYKVIKSTEHSGFTELSQLKKRVFGPKPRNQFGYLARNAISCLKNKKNKSLCDSYDSLVDMIIINGLIQSSKKDGRKINIKIPKD